LVGLPALLSTAAAVDVVQGERLRGMLFGKDAYDAGGDFVMDDRLVIFSNAEIDSEFLLQMRYIVEMINKNTVGDLQ
jgi:hypothetical protein